MQRLVEGVYHFQTVGFANHRPLFERLTHVQKPLACFITCSDSRINPNLITSTEPGDLFIIRNVGNIIPAHGSDGAGESAAIEFAVEGLEVPDIIVCGHTNCGAMKGLLGSSDDLRRMPAVQRWLHHADATGRIIEENYQHLVDNARLTAAAEVNVLVQVEHLQTLPVIAARLNRGRLNLHAWMYKIETGEIFAYDIQHKQFRLLTELRAAAPAGTGVELASAELERVKA